MRAKQGAINQRSESPRVRKFKSARKFNRLLKADPQICIIITPSAPWKVMRAEFRNLCGLDPYEQITDRIARVRSGWQVVIDEGGFWARRFDQGPVGPSIFTNAEMIERHAITYVDGPSLTREQRQREAAAAYGMRPVFGRV